MRRAAARNNARATDATINKAADEVVRKAGLQFALRRSVQVWDSGTADRDFLINREGTIQWLCSG